MQSKLIITFILVVLLFQFNIAQVNADETYVLYDEHEIYTIAARSAGEARLSGVTAVSYVACTIHNRLERGYGNGQLEHVLNAYYAKDFIPTKGELALVDFYLNGNRCPTDILYALSYSDIVYLGFDKNLADYAVGTNREVTYFYSKWGN